MSDCVIYIYMTCYHPNLVELTNFRSATYDPKKKLIFHGSCEKNLLRISQQLSSRIADFILVPCGHCLGCRIDKARDWSVRLMCEELTSSSAWFLTLTYDDEHLPKDFSLQKKHFQEFIKDLRNYVYYINPDVKLRYFGCGEYGETAGRPHYHIIIFNMPKLDLIQWKVSKRGDVYYTSEKLNEIWGKGYVVTTGVTYQSCNYVARYTLKKLNAPEYERLKIQSPFILMSCRPGIGYDYAVQNSFRLLDEKKIYLPNGKIATIPRYFMRVLSNNPDLEYSVLMYKRELKENSFDRQFIKYIQSNCEEIEDQLRHEELNLEAMMKNFKGGLL